MIARISTYFSPSLFRPTPSINDPVQSFNDGSYKRHTDPLQYNTYGNHHGYTITILPNYPLRYIPRRLVWWVAVHHTPTTIIHVITIIFVIILAFQVIGSKICRDWAPFRNRVSHVLSRERAVILNRRY